MCTKNILSRTLFAGWILFFIVSCIREDFVILPQEEPEVPEGMVRVELYTNIQEYTYPESRALADETRISTTPMVIVFEGSNGTAIFSEAAQAVYANGKTTVTLSANENPCIIMVVSNLPDNKFFDGTNELNFDEANLASTLSGKTITQCEQLLMTQKLTAPLQTTRPFPNTTDVLPMSGTITVSHIDIDTKIGESGNELTLTRLVAKVSVQTDISTMWLMGAGLVNAPCNGAVYLNDRTTPPDNSSNLTHYLANTTNVNAVMTMGAPNSTYKSTSDNPLYMYECNKSEEPAVLIYIMDMSGNSFSGFYKLVFKEGEEILHVLRNKNYVFNIKSVNTVGYATPEEAINASPANIDYEVIVTDAYAHDMVSNGEYFIGVSNSQVIVYDHITPNTQVATLDNAFTITTNACSEMGVTTAEVSYSSTGGRLSGTTTVNLAPAKGDIGMTNVSLNLNASFNANSSYSLTIKIGNLTKTVTVTRYSALDYRGHVGELPHDDYVSCEVISRGNDDWLFVTNDRYSIIDQSESIYLTQPGKFYVLATKNMHTENGTKRTGAEILLTRAYEGSEGGRIKVILSQGVFNTGIEPPTDFTSGTAYMGAFWRNDQTGERLIRIPYHSDLVGNWQAIAMDDWIKLDKEPTQDPGVTWNANTENPADMIDYDYLYQLPGDSSSITGTLTNSASDFIYFRIGLKSTYTPTADAPNRYGRVLLFYGGSLSKYMVIYIRQGENADYLMRPEDPEGGNGAGWGTVAKPRPLARKFTPYNLTAQQYINDPINTGGTNVTNHPQLAVGGGVFVRYPTQGGAYFQWFSESNPRRAYHPVNPNPNTQITGWEQTHDKVNQKTWKDVMNMNETCPSDYRRPYDGDISTLVSSLTNTMAESEIRQSLWWFEQNGQSNPSKVNSLHGYYADGFYDRRQRVDPPSINTFMPESAVSVKNANIAFYGHLVYNPYNHASLFFPAAGYKEYTSVTSFSSYYGFYWAGRRLDVTDGGSGITSSASRIFFFGNSAARVTTGGTAAAGNIRCIKE